MTGTGKGAAENSRQQHAIGRDILGPVIAQFLWRLDAHIAAFETRGKPRILFAARAGIRIQRLYRLFLTARGETPRDHTLFWMSRFMTAKGIWRRAPELTLELLQREFPDARLMDVAAAVFASQGGAPTDFPFLDPQLGDRFSARRFLSPGAGPAVERIRQHLDGQAALFEEYLGGLMAGRDAAVLVDSGWQGTAQSLLARAFPEWDWSGLYLGRSFMPGSDRADARLVAGLCFESDAYDPARPETAIVLHRHLIESLLEPAGPSVESLVRVRGGITAPQARALTKDAANSPLLAGVEEHLRSPEAAAAAPWQLMAQAQAAAPALAQLLSAPSRAQALALAGFERSADFGRDALVPVLLPADGSGTVEDRVAASLWPQGQVALEYPDALAAMRHKAMLGALPAAPRAPVPAAPTEVPAVAVVMRTMDRVLFLDRAIASVAQQRFTDYRLVIVCDGGPIAPVLDAVERSTIDRRKVVVIENETNRGMEAASNIGIAGSASEFVVIHDDDDSWHPHFLQRGVDFLRGRDGAKYGGVVTHSVYVSEEVTPDGIVEHGRSGYQDWFSNVQVSEMACGNFFPPIAFLFRRAVCDRVGGFDETLPVLGDWDFNLRVLAVAEIGVIRDKLAHYHHRDRGDRATYANSVFGQVGKHAEYNAIMRNRFLRGDRGPASEALGTLVSVGNVLSEMRGRLQALESRTPTRRAEPGETERALETATRLADDRWVMIKGLQRGMQELRQAHEQALIAQERRLEQVQALADQRWLQLWLVFQSFRSLEAAGAGTAAVPPPAKETPHGVDQHRDQPGQRHAVQADQLGAGHAPARFRRRRLPA